MVILSKFAKQNNIPLVYCKDVFQKTIGLMFSKQDKILIFYFDKEMIQSVHMLFVFFPIDLYFLNKKKVVVEIKKNFRPFSFYKSKKKARYMIEIPSSISKHIRIKIDKKCIL